MLNFDLVDDLLNFDNIGKKNPIYVDSVCGRSEIIVEGGEYKPIENLFKRVDKKIGEKEYYYPINENDNVLTLKSGISVYGKVKYVMRHLTDKQMYRVFATNEEYVDVTEDHSIMTYINKSKLPTVDNITQRFQMNKPLELSKKSGIYLKHIPDCPVIYGEFYNEVAALCKNDTVLIKKVFQLFGFFIGDGSYHKSCNKNYYINLSLGLDKKDLLDKILNPLLDKSIITSISHNKNNFDVVINNYSFIKIFNKLRTFTATKNTKCIPVEFKCLPIDLKIAFIQGYFEADGTVIVRGNSVIIRLTSTVIEYLEHIQHMLFTMGISSRIFGENNYNSYNGKVSNTKSKHLTILTTKKFIKSIGFISDRKNKTCLKFSSKYNKITYEDYDFELAKNLKIEKLPRQLRYVYDIEVADTHVFFANNFLVHNTDSVFLTLPCSLENETDKAMDYIEQLQNVINLDTLKHFLDLHNVKIREKEDNPLLWLDFKNEYMIKSMILYSKKRYISTIIKRKTNGELYYDIDLKGVEGKRVTNKFVKILVENLLEYIKKLDNINDIYNRFEILTLVVKKYIDELYAADSKNIYKVLDYFALPVNVGKQIIDLKNVAGYYKGTISFDIISGEKFWKGRTGKGKWIAVKLKDDSFIPQILGEFSKFEQIKMGKKKPHDLIKDITIPDEYLQKENDVVTDLFNVFELNYEYYTELLLKKIKLMYNPFDPMLCDNLLKKRKNDAPQNFMIFGDDAIYEKLL